MENKNSDNYEKKQKRFVYCKTGNVVNELRILGPNPNNVSPGGPDHYVASFLTLAYDNPTLLLSYQFENSTFENQSVNAIVYNKTPAYPSVILKSLKWISLFFKTFFSLKDFKPSHLLCASPGLPLLACFVYCKLYNIPLILVRHAELTDAKAGWLKKIAIKIEASALRNINKIICHGPFLENELLKNGVNKSNILQYNISYRYLLSLKKANTKKTNFNFNRSDFCLLFTGRMHFEKGIFDLLHASIPLFSKHKNLKLIFAGDGPDLNKLQSDLKSLKIEDRVQLLGHVEHDLLPELISNCKIVITPTHSSFPESRCKSAIEGLVLGKPVIAPHFGPFPFVVNNEKNGLMFEPDSVEDLRLKISLLLNDSELYKKLKSGANLSGKNLLDAKCSYTDALQTIFAHDTD